MIKESLKSAIDRILDENYVISDDVENLVLSESASSAISKIGDTSFAKVNKFKSQFKQYTKDKEFKYDEDFNNRMFKIKTDGLKRNIKIYSNEFNKVGIDLAKLEYDSNNDLGHVISVLESNEVVVAVFYSYVGCDYYDKRLYTNEFLINYANLCVYIPIIKDGKLQNIAIYVVAGGTIDSKLSWDRKDGKATSKYFPTLKFDKKKKEQNGFAFYTVGEFKDMYNELLKREDHPYFDKGLPRDYKGHKSYTFTTVGIMHAPIDTELVKEVIKKMKLRRLNAAIDKKMAKDNQRLLVKNTKAFENILKNYSKAIEPKFDEWIESHKDDKGYGSQIARLIDRFKNDSNNKTIEDAFDWVRSTPRIKQAMNNLGLELTLDKKSNLSKIIQASWGRWNNNELAKRGYNTRVNVNSRPLKLVVFMLYIAFLSGREDEDKRARTLDRVDTLTQSTEAVVANVSPSEMANAFIRAFDNLNKNEQDDYSEEVDNRDSETLEEAVSMNPRDLISKVSTLLRDLPKHTFLGINLANLVKNSKVYKFGDKTEIDNETYRWSDIITKNVPTPKTKILSSAKFSYVKEFKFNYCWVDIIEKEKAEKGDAIGLRFTFDGELKIDEDFTHNLQDVGDAFRQVIEDGRTLIPKNSKPIGFKAKLKDFIKTIMNKDVLWDGWHYTKAVGGDYNVRSGDYIRGGSDFDQMWADSPIAYEDKGDGVYKFCLCLSYRTPGRFGDYRDN